MRFPFRHSQPLLPRGLLSPHVLAMAGVLGLGATSALAQATLEEIQVQAQPDAQALPAPAPGGQVAKGAGLGLLGQREALDTPFNITSYTQQLMADQQSATVAGVLENDPSVRFTTNTGHAYENFSIRGLEVNATEVGFNGLYGLAPDAHIPTEMLERVEVLKGPGALLNGMTPGGAVGGVVNVVTKRPTADDRTQVITSYASDAQLGVQADVSRRFGPERRLGIRVNGSMASGETDIDDQKRRKRLGALALDYQGDRWSLGLDAYSYRSHIANGSPLMVGFATVGRMVAAPAANLNQFRGMNAEQQSDGALLRGSVDLSEDWTAYASLGWAEHSYTGMLNGTRGILRTDGHTLDTQNYQQYGFTRSWTGDAGLRGRLRTGAVAHEVVLSMNQLRQEGGRALNAKGGIPTASYVSDLYHPTLDTVIANQPTAYKQERDNVITSYALADTLRFAGDTLAVTAGARLQQVQQKMAGYDEQAVTPMLGIVAKPWSPNLALYANYIEGLSAGTTVAAGYANAGETLKPYKTRQLETGVKWQGTGWMHTFSLFQITKPSAISVTSAGASLPTLVEDGEQRNRGVEWTVSGQLAPAWSVLGGISYTQAKQTKTQGGLKDGNDVYGVPRWTANLGAQWSVPAVPGLALSGRMVYTGAQQVNSSNTLQAPAWTRFDAGVRYATRLSNHAVTWRANLENAFGRKYWAGAFNDNFMTVGAPRTLLLSATVDF
ncbi:TonB-dependent receptor [Comamonas antarctica]|uniref:TonB-dependent receptor n=1 Tax=Comamonas antarctica TaxID=2743470 RepID=A0A6N1X7J0_9BURK|nr:TonB-dependent receptor [Comamonas antarctica]QKV55341.1 TonB-dependent receptor [Comamonas antarctica]